MALLSLSLLASSPTLFQRLIFGPEPLHPAVWLLYSFLIVAVPITTFVSLVAMLGIWGERKVAGHIQSRIGPNRVGPMGLFQSLADGIKLLLKEDLVPREADPLLFRLAPYIAFAAVFAAFIAMPFGPEMTFEPRLNVGVFYLLAVLSVEVMAIILAGWASNNKWSIYGAMREAGQMVSYEIPLGVAIIVAVMTAGTLNLVELAHAQAGGIHTWLIFSNPFVLLAFLVYFVASLASNKRAPFDLPEAESELVGGFHTEYSGLRFSFFFFAEYGAMFVVAAIQVTLFLGGWNDPFGLIGYYHHHFTQTGNDTGLLLVNLAAAAIFVLKAALIVYVQMWIRWSLPRPRIDQVLYACMKVLLPAAMTLLAGGAVWQLFVMERPGRPWRDYHPFSLAGWEGHMGALFTHIVLAIVGVTLFFLVLGWVGYAWWTGRRTPQRLSEAAHIDDGRGGAEGTA